MKNRNLFALIAFLTLVAQLAVAQDEVAPTPTALPKSGSLASSFTGGTSGTAPTSWGSPVEMSESPAPIGGSVSKVGSSWLAKVFNNTKDSYSANVKVVQINARGGSARNDYFSVTLKAGESVERNYPVAPGGVSASLELASWKKIGGTTTTAAPANANAVSGRVETRPSSDPGIATQE